MNVIFENTRWSRKWQHFLFWTCWVVFFTFIRSIGYSANVYLDWLLYYLLTLPIFVAHTYLIAYWLVPKFFLTKKYPQLVGMVFLFLLFFSAVELVFSNEIIFEMVIRTVEPESHYFTFKNILISGIGNHYVILLFLAAKALKKWYETEGERNELHRKTLQTEISLIQNQLHPRFLFDSMELMEKMALEKSPETPNLIIQLSNLLGNVIVEKGSELVSVRKEIDLIESYLEIQKLVKFPGMSVQVLRSGDLEVNKIPPLLFFSVIEFSLLSFENEGCNPFMKIFIRSENNYLLFFASFKCEIVGDFKQKFQHIIDQTKGRLAFCYGDNCRVSIDEGNELKEFTIEIFRNE